MTLLLALAWLLALGFLALAFAFWRAPSGAEFYAGHSRIAFHSVMAGRYVSFVGFAAICAWWGDPALVSAVFAVFAATALIDFFTYSNPAVRGGDAIKHLIACVISAGIAALGFCESMGSEA